MFQRRDDQTKGRKKRAGCNTHILKKNRGVNESADYFPRCFESGTGKWSIWSKELGRENVDRSEELRGGQTIMRLKTPVKMYSPHCGFKWDGEKWDELPPCCRDVWFKGVQDNCWLLTVVKFLMATLRLVSPWFSSFEQTPGDSKGKSLTDTS